MNPTWTPSTDYPPFALKGELASAPPEPERFAEVSGLRLTWVRTSVTLATTPKSLRCSAARTAPSPFVEAGRREERQHPRDHGEKNHNPEHGPAPDEVGSHADWLYFTRL